jgi:hypothetical protein
MLQSIENLEKKKKNLNNEKIKIPIEAKNSYGVYLLEAKFTLKVGMCKHFNIC